MLSYTDYIEPCFLFEDPVFRSEEFKAENPHFIDGIPSIKGVPFMNIVAGNSIISQITLGDKSLQVKLPVIGDYVSDYIKCEVPFGVRWRTLKGKDYVKASNTMYNIVLEAIEKYSHSKELGCEYVASEDQDKDALVQFSKMCLDAYRAR